MTKKTHAAVGTAAATVILLPDNLKFLSICLAASLIGSILPDIDLTTSNSQKDLFRIVLSTLFTLGVCLLLEVYAKIQVITMIVSNANAFALVSGFITFLIVCLFGILTPHRTFTHSITFIVILDCIFYYMFKSFLIVIPFSIGLLSHIIIDLLTTKNVKFLFPLNVKFSFKFCSSDGKVNKLLFYIGFVTLISTITLLVTNVYSV